MEIQMEMDERAEVYSIISDLTKDLYGRRDRFNWQDYSLAELNEMLNNLQQSLEREIEREKNSAHYWAEVEAYEIRKISADLGVDPETCIRWLEDAA